jgi:alpha-mannosidase
VPKLAKVFNAPLKAKFASTGAVHQLASDVRGPFTVEGAPNVILDTVKRGDDDDFLSANTSKSVICRLFESKGGHARAKLVTTLPVAKASIVDLLERTTEELEVVCSSDGKCSVKLPFKGFQFITVKLDL